MPHGVCYSRFSNGVRNGAISITQRVFINDRYKVNPVGQWGKILVMAMGFVDHLGHCLYMYVLYVDKKESLGRITAAMPERVDERGPHQ